MTKEQFDSLKKGDWVYKLSSCSFQLEMYMVSSEKMKRETRYRGLAEFYDAGLGRNPETEIVDTYLLTPITQLVNRSYTYSVKIAGLGNSASPIDEPNRLCYEEAMAYMVAVEEIKDIADDLLKSAIEYSKKRERAFETFTDLAIQLNMVVSDQSKISS